MSHSIFSKQRGASAVFGIGLVVLAILMSSFSVDMAYYYTQQNRMQVAADSAAAAAAYELYNNPAASFSTRETAAKNAARAFVEDNSDWTLSDGDIYIGYIDPTTRDYDDTSYVIPTAAPTYADTAGNNTVRVVLRAGAGTTNAPVSALFTRYMGRTELPTQAIGSAMYDTSIAAFKTARPFLVCDAAWQQASALSTDPSGITVRLYEDSFELTNGGSTSTYSGASACSGNGFSLVNFSNSCGSGLNDCSSGSGPNNTDLSDWTSNGYSGWANIGTSYRFDDGGSLNASTDSDIDNIIGTNIYVPLFSQTSGNGVLINGMATFVIESYSSSGVSNYIEGHFLPSTTCTSNCQIGTGTAANDSAAKIVLIH